MPTDVTGGAGDQDTLSKKVNGRMMVGREVRTLREGFSVEGIGWWRTGGWPGYA